MPDNRPLNLTKILATVGPACGSVDMLLKLIDEGVTAFRINFSHGTIEQFAASLANIREAERLCGRAVGALGDLTGPKIRLGKVRDQAPDGKGGVMLDVGDTVELQLDAPEGGGGRFIDGGPAIFNTNTPSLIDDIHPGQRLLLDDGNVRMLVTERRGSPDDPHRRLICTVTVGNRISSAKGINLPDTDLSLPAITDRDWMCAQWAVDHHLDYLALSFVRRAEDVHRLRAFLKSKGSSIPIVSKIEKPQAVADLDAIVKASDGLMVARGDLGVEMDLAEVPVVQKRILQSAHDHGRPVIVATQMLQSMIDAPHPTRAEASDVANAIFDGADTVMLSGETAVGKYPVQAVHTMARIAHFAEANRHLDPGSMHRSPRHPRETRYRTAALAHGVSVIVQDMQARLVATWSELGGTALYLSQNRLTVPILVASSSLTTLRRLTLMFGVVGLHLPRPANADELVTQLDAIAQERGLAEPGDAMVIARGEPLGTPGVTNNIRIHYIGDVCRVRWTAKDA